MTLKIVFQEFSSDNVGYIQNPPSSQPTSDVEQLREDTAEATKKLNAIARLIIAIANQDLFEKTIEDQTPQDVIAVHPTRLKPLRNLTGKNNFEIGPLKTRRRTIQKAENDYDGEVAQVTDICRAKIEASPSPEHNDRIAALVVAAEWLYKNRDFVALPHNAVIVGFDNRFGNPTATGYESLKLKILIPLENSDRDYHICELMIRHKGFEQEISQQKYYTWGKRGSHEMYALSRSFEGKLEDGTITHQEELKLSEIRGICTRIHVEASRKMKMRNIPYDEFRALREQHTDKELSRVIHMLNQNGREEPENNVVNLDIP